MLEVLASAAPAFFPVLSDGIRGMFARFTGNAGAAPQNTEEYIAAQRVETERLQALAALDTVGDTYKWVNAVRSLQRPFAVFMVLGGYTATVVLGLTDDPETLDYLRVFAQSSVFYLFGDRTNWYAQRGGNGR